MIIQSRSSLITTIAGSNVPDHASANIIMIVTNK